MNGYAGRGKHVVRGGLAFYARRPVAAWLGAASNDAGRAPGDVSWAYGLDRGLRASMGAYVAVCRVDGTMPPVFAPWVGLSVANDEHASGRVVALRRARIASTVRSIFRRPS